MPVRARVVFRPLLRRPGRRSTTGRPAAGHLNSAASGDAADGSPHDPRARCSGRRRYRHLALRHLAATRGGRGSVRSGEGRTVTATEVSDDVRFDGWRWASAEQPYLYEINTWPWLHQLSVEAGRSIDLSTVPDERWAALADAGFDAVWLMGVWARSAAGAAIALNNTELVGSFQAVLPDYRPEDVVGSPYCVRDYQVDPRLGGRDGLAHARAALARHGLGLDPGLRPQPRRTRPPRGRARTRSSSSGAAARTSRTIRSPSSRSTAPCWPGVGIRTSRHGRTSCSSTHSPPPCARRSSTRSATSPSSATECAATWRC